MTLDELYELARSLGLEVDSVAMRELESASFPEGWIALDPGKMDGLADEKAHLAHEMGHCETGSFYNIYSPFDLRQKHENRAQRWAIETLVPRAKLEDAVKDGLSSVWELADEFGVPPAFMMQAIDYYRKLDVKILAGDAPIPT